MNFLTNLISGLFFLSIPISGETVFTKNKESGKTTGIKP